MVGWNGASLGADSHSERARAKLPRPSSATEVIAPLSPDRMTPSEMKWGVQGGLALAGAVASGMFSERIGTGMEGGGAPALDFGDVDCHPSDLAVRWLLFNEFMRCCRESKGRSAAHIWHS
jgi:hypothetical protein